MSDEDRDIDVESDDEDNSITQYMTQAEKRAHHNALERKRRDHIKDSFNGLRDCIPSLAGEKASRAQILKQATDYIEFMDRKNGQVTQDIDDLKGQNTDLEQQIKSLEKAKRVGNYASSLNVGTVDSDKDTDSDDDVLESYQPSSRKKMKI